MSRIRSTFEALKVQSKTALIPYVMTGDPNLDATVPLMHAMVEAGADMIELGAPFSDPMADGPVIQAASERALAQNVSLHSVFESVKAFRETDDKTPIVMMGYLNPIEIMGYAEFAKQASSCGIDGVITVDMPPEEARDYLEAMSACEIDPIFLVAPTSTEERIEMIAKVASGFVYYVSLKGVTGAATLDVDSVAAKLSMIRKHIDIPVGVGFGISDAEAASKVAAHSDAVVVGSAIVKKMINAAGEDNTTSVIIEDVTSLLKSMRKAMDA